MFVYLFIYLFSLNFQHAGDETFGWYLSISEYLVWANIHLDIQNNANIEHKT